MSLAKSVPEALDEFVSARETLLKLSVEVSAEDLHLFYQIALIGRRDLPLSPDARNGFEMIMLRLLAFRPASAGTMQAGMTQGGVTQAGIKQAGAVQQSSQPAVTAAKNSIQPQVSPPPSAQQQARQAASAATPVQANQAVGQVVSQAINQRSAETAGSEAASQQTAPAVPQTAAPVAVTAVSTSDGSPVSNDWREVVNGLGLGGLVKQLAINCTMQRRDGCNIELQIESGHSNLLNPKAKQRLQQALGEYFNIEAQLEIKLVSRNETSSESGSTIETPAQTTRREIDQRQQQAEESINEDSFTRSLKENFSAELIPGSVKPVS